MNQHIQSAISSLEELDKTLSEPDGTTLKQNEMKFSKLSANKETESFTVSLKAGVEYMIATQSYKNNRMLDTVVTLKKGNKVISSNDDYFGTNAKLKTRVPSDGIYEVIVSMYSGNECEYLIYVVELEDYLKANVR